MFLSQLKRQKYYPVSDSDSSILFGNPDASLRITIMTNPHCEPCAAMHKRVEKILETNENNICIQYVFAAFNEDLYSSNQFLVAVYLKEEKSRINTIFSDWFKSKKYRKDTYIKQFNLDFENEYIKKELDKHDRWIQQSQIIATPSVLINGYELPENYKIEDMIYFTEIKIN